MTMPSTKPSTTSSTTPSTKPSSGSRLPPLKRTPGWFEVWPARFGFYRIRKVGAAIGPFPLAPTNAMIVWGRDRAIRRAKALQAAQDAPPPPPPQPVFSTQAVSAPRRDDSPI